MNIFLCSSLIITEWMLFLNCMTHFFAPFSFTLWKKHEIFWNILYKDRPSWEGKRERKKTFFWSFSLSFLSLDKCWVYKSEEDIAQSEHIRSGDPIVNITLKEFNNIRRISVLETKQVRNYLLFCKNYMYIRLNCYLTQAPITLISLVLM